jgi:hypothetical protein
VISAGIVYTGELAAFPIVVWAALNVVLTAAWLTVAAALNRRLPAQDAAAGGTP